MLIEYIDEALRRAHYEIIDDKERYYGKIQELKGVWATGDTLQKCRENFKDVIEGWILLSLKKGLPVPKLLNYSAFSGLSLTSLTSLEILSQSSCLLSFPLSAL